VTAAGIALNEDDRSPIAGEMEGRDQPNNAATHDHDIRHTHLLTTSAA
jgi:hypothetical protein